MTDKKAYAVEDFNCCFYISARACYKSRRSDVSIGPGQAYLIRFRNCSYTVIDVIWIDFDGNEQVYHRLQPYEYFNCNTFTNHVWIARDVTNNKRMKLCGNPLYVMNETHLYLLAKCNSNIYGLDSLFTVQITSPMETLRVITERNLVWRFMRSSTTSFSQYLKAAHSRGVPKQVLYDAFLNCGIPASQVIMSPNTLFNLRKPVLLSKDQ